jgi:hypothetical protein
VNGDINPTFLQLHGNASCVAKTTKEVAYMPTARELTIRLGDRPGTLGRVCRALADHKVNIIAFQSTPVEGDSLIRFVVDHLEAGKVVLDNEGLSYSETEVAQARLPHRPGELARAASQLGDADININYAYCGVDPSTNRPLVIFGVAEAGQAAAILDRTAAAA